MKITLISDELLHQFPFTSLKAIYDVLTVTLMQWEMFLDDS